MIQFPKDFYWGSATSSYQVEGDNANADWWPWEIKAGKERSGKACNHYELFEQDFDLVKSLNHNAHRLSIEWSRVEPREGEFSNEAIAHYVEVIKALRRRGIEPMVTLHHFTNPVWFSESGGWADKRSVQRFLNYVEFVTRALARGIHYWFTINEPSVYFSHSYLWGMWPPQDKSFFKTKLVFHNLNTAHMMAYKLINWIYKDMKVDKPMIGLAHHMQAIVPCDNSPINRFAASIREYWYNLVILDNLAHHNTLDFIGLNYYSRHLVHAHSWWIGNLIMETCKDNHHPCEKNSLGWDIYPEGLTRVLLSLKKYNLPVIISENGICTSDDDQRWRYIQSHLKSVHSAIEQGVDVRGYLYWSLMDNFEWAHGYGPRFGLIDVNYETQQRTIRPSALQFAKVCQTGTLEP